MRDDTTSTGASYVERVSSSVETTTSGICREAEPSEAARRAGGVVGVPELEEGATGQITDVRPATAAGWRISGASSLDKR